MAIDTTECTRMAAIAGESQKIGAFIDWLAEANYTICERVPKGGWGADTLTPTRKSIEQLLADYFEIDLVKVETERSAILAAFRESQSSYSA